ncbi:MAG TPA: shikimate dehydrogenase [Acidimicrobiales bacterium]|nr:shikimate dehydrogenase [Acidimicrobiales bacterium]
MPLLNMTEARHAVRAPVRIVGVIGSPVAHSLSPLLHTTAFDALGLGDTWCSFAFEVEPGQAAAALADMRRSDVSGLSVTMPHKADVAALVDESSDVARRLNAVNCIVQRGGVLYGTNTDGEGFVASLARGAGFDPAGRRCLVAGAGGAARAVVLALADAGASQVAVVNRTPERAREAAALAGPAGTTVAASEQEALVEAVQAADLVVNATPLGMAGTETLRDAMETARQWLVPPELLHEGQVAADLVYVPRPTPWLVEAATHGATTLDGLGMLVHQAAAQVLLWTGQEPPVHTMWEAASETMNPNPQW